MERLIVWQRCSVSARDDDAEVLGRWSGEAAAKLEGAGGEILACLGSSVVAAFDPVDVSSVLELALTLVQQAEAAAAEGAPSIALGVTLGEVLAHEGASLAAVTFIGLAIDRAQALANRARNGEVVLDSAAQERAGEHFLFSRSVVVGAVRGAAIDRTFPHKRDCRDAIRLLRAAPLSPPEAVIVQQIEALQSSPGAHRVVLRVGNNAALMALIESARAKMQPPLYLHVGRQAGGLQPLGGLQLALRRCLGPVEDKLSVVLGNLGLDESVVSALQSISDGAAIERPDAVRAFEALLLAAGRSAIRSGETRPARPWVVLESLHEIDAASLGVLADAGLQAESDVLLLATVASDGHVPAPLTKGAQVHDLSLPGLRMSEARAVAEHILSLDTGAEVARRVALLGGDTRIGVIEAARTLIAAGDLIHDGQKFAWRTGPREGSGAVSVDALLTERISSLDTAAYRMLEVLCTSAPCAPRSRISTAATFDGLDSADHDRAIRVLRAEGLLDSSGNLEPASSLIRSAFRANMPPARAAELHRYTIDAVRAEPVMHDQLCFAQALLGFHLAEGGLEREAAVALLAAARAAVATGFQRSAVRLAAAAVQLDGSPNTRLLASTIARAVDKGATTSDSIRPGSLSVPPPSGALTEPPPIGIRADSTRIGEDAIQAAIAAIFARDFDAVERCIDTALAAGQSQAAAERLRAMAHLARGNVGDALRTLENAASQRDMPRSTPRDSIASALVQLQSGHAGEALRSALDALGNARAHDDRRGQSASLHVLAGCFRALDRRDDAARLQAVANAL